MSNLLQSINLPTILVTIVAVVLLVLLNGAIGPGSENRDAVAGLRTSLAQHHDQLMAALDSHHAALEAAAQAGHQCAVPADG